jgi:hypothetical protein
LRVGSVSTRADDAIARALFAVKFQIAIQRWSHPTLVALLAQARYYAVMTRLRFQWLDLNLMNFSEAKAEIARLYAIGIETRASIVVFAKHDEDHEYALTHVGWFRHPEPAKVPVIVPEPVEVDVFIALEDFVF